MLNMEALAAMAAEAGFTHSAPLDVSTLELRDEVRAMCSANTCRAYGKNWSCPPACGELEDLRQRFAQYSRGILVQTVGEVEDSMDFEGMMESFFKNLYAFSNFDSNLSFFFLLLPLLFGTFSCESKWKGK